MGYHRDFDTDKLSEEAEAKLRKFLKTNEIGRILRDDIKEKPYKLCAWLLSSAALASVMAITLAMKMRSEDVRQRFRDAAEKPLNLKFFESALKQCPETGELNVCSKTLFRQQRKAATMHLKHLVEFGLAQLPRNKFVSSAERLYIKMTRYEFPAVVEDTHDRPKRNWKGAAFALASIAHMEPSDIAQHLAPRDRQLFEQEYATQEL